ncbi:MAG: methionyl-tRNA formyltransferase [bacterium]
MSNPPFRAVFLGTPAAAVPSLEKLAQVAEVVAVVTRPDRPMGRSKRPVPSPVKAAALARGLNVVEAARGAAIDPRLFEVDLAVVTAFGVIIPANVLKAPKHGLVNVHFSLLPRWRGASPVAAAIAAGDQETGVSIMSLEEGLDTGPVFAALSVVIGGEETAGELTERLALVGASLLAETLPALLAGRLTPVPQDGARATYAPRLQASDRILDLRQSAESNARKIRALTPKPGAVLLLDGERLGVIAARPTDRDLPTGQFETTGDRLMVGSAGGALELLTVRPEGRKEMAGSDWARGWRRPPVVDQ